MGHDEVLIKIVQKNGPLSNINAVLQYFPIYRKTMLEMGVVPISMRGFSNLYMKILSKLGLSKGLVDPSDGVYVWRDEYYY